MQPDILPILYSNFICCEWTANLFGPGVGVDVGRDKGLEEAHVLRQVWEYPELQQKNKTSFVILTGLFVLNDVLEKVVWN